MSTKALLFASLVGAVFAECPATTNVLDVCSKGEGEDDVLSVTPAYLANDAAAWSDVPGSAFKDVPAFLQGLLMQVPKQNLTKGSTVRFTCPPGSNTCDAYVFLYECSPCQTEKGALPTYLMGNSWERSRCAPFFVTGVANGHHHRMISYRKTVAPGDVETFMTLGDVEWAAFAISSDSVDCSSKNPTQCTDPSLKDFCRWNGQCEVAKCHFGGPSPMTGCDLNTCVGTEFPVATSSPPAGPPPCGTMPVEVRFAAFPLVPSIPVVQWAGQPVVQGLTPRADAAYSLRDFPDAFLAAGMKAYYPADPQAQMNVGAQISVVCPESCDGTHCEVFVPTYYCPPCTSSANNGGLPTTLPNANWAAGWETVMCSPTFRTEVAGADFPTSAFRKVIPSGTTYDLPLLTSTLAHTGVYVRQGAVICTDITSDSDCRTASECRWEMTGFFGGECVVDWCSRGSDAPLPQTCDTCAAVV